MLSIGQAAAQIGVSRPTLWRWDRNGKLVAHRTLGNHRRYTQRQVDWVIRGKPDRFEAGQITDGDSTPIKNPFYRPDNRQTEGKAHRSGIPYVYARVSAFDVLSSKLISY